MATTPQHAQRHVPGAPNTTKPASLAASTPRKPTHEVQGPASLPVTGKAMATRSGSPPLHGANAQSAKPPQQR